MTTLTSDYGDEVYEHHPLVEQGSSKLKAMEAGNCFALNFNNKRVRTVLRSTF